MKESRAKQVKTNTGPRGRTAKTIESRENQMIALAMNRAEERLRDGTASAQEIVHFLKLGSTKERLEKDLLRKQNEYLTAKIEAIQSSKNSEEMYAEAIKALQTYGGTKDDSTIF